MLLHRFQNIPSARHAGRECDKIARLDGDGLSAAAIRRDDDLALQQVAGFRFPVRPGKFRNAAAPRAPAKHALLFEKGRSGSAITSISCCTDDDDDDMCRTVPVAGGRILWLDDGGPSTKADTTAAVGETINQRRTNNQRDVRAFLNIVFLLVVAAVQSRSSI